MHVTQEEIAEKSIANKDEIRSSCSQIKSEW